MSTVVLPKIRGVPLLAAEDQQNRRHSRGSVSPNVMMITAWFRRCAGFAGLVSS